MVKSVETITELIGNTPLVKLNRLVSDDSADVYVKVESFNAGGSVKDRIALNIIETAEKDGSLKPGDTIIEATSGNTGVGLSLIGAAKGYKVITIMPESMSIERRQLMKAYGTEVLLTPAADGFGAAVAKAEELAAQPGYFWARNLTTKQTQLSTIKQLDKKSLKPSTEKHQTLTSVVLVLVVRLQVLAVR